MSKTVKRITIIIAISLLVIEILGRYNEINIYPIYEYSKKYEYRLVPNQKIEFSNGKIFSTNSYGMRSEEVSDKKKKILLIGDSVLYGGNRSDNAEIASNHLQAIFNKESQSFQILNISAKSWGPDNAAAFLEEHGLFNSEIMVLVVNSHDAYDTMTLKPIVGVDYRYPEKKSLLALEDFFGRAFRNIEDIFFNEQKKQNSINTSKQIFNPGFASIYKLCHRNKTPLIVYHHLTYNEITNKKINHEGQLIKKFCLEHDITFYTELELKPQINYLNGSIHFNSAGQIYLASNLEDIIKRYLKK